MIIGNEQDVTGALLDDLAHAPDARFREIMSVVVRHLHDLAREVRLTEAEFHQACAVVAKLGQLSKFGVTHALVGRYLLHETGAAPATDIDGPWHSLDHHVVIEPGEARLPAPPITGRAAG